MANRKQQNKKQSEQIITFCRDCKHVTPVMRFETLTVHGRHPTLGTCPYWQKSKYVLLSQRACEKFEYAK